MRFRLSELSPIRENNETVGARGPIPANTDKLWKLVNATPSGRDNIRVDAIKYRGNKHLVNFLIVFFGFCCSQSVKGEKCRIVQNTMMTCREATADDLPKTRNEKIEWILFTKSSVPVLKKEHLENYPGLTDLHAEKNEIEKIEEDAFVNSKALDWVDVSFNKLTFIHPDIFKNNPKVYYFNVSGNPNLIIPENAPFINAPNLQWLLLQQSKIKIVYSETFKNVPGLKVLSLSENELTTLPEDVFQPLKNLYSLDLSKNKFTTLPVTLFEPLKYISLYLADNPWDCDCNLYPTIQWTKNRRVKDEVWCSKPDKKKWQEVVNLKCPDVVEVF